ncbi:hypothetical protein Pcinc_019435, partial [Petrolisthes cinctipes]
CRQSLTARTVFPPASTHTQTHTHRQAGRRVFQTSGDLLASSIKQSSHQQTN